MVNNEMRTSPDAALARMIDLFNQYIEQIDVCLRGGDDPKNEPNVQCARTAYEQAVDDWHSLQ